MFDLAVAALFALAPGRLASVAAPDRTEVLREEGQEPERKDPCSGREGWVGDGEDGRAPPSCEGPDGDADPEAEGLRAPDWLRREEEDGEAGDYER